MTRTWKASAAAAALIMGGLIFGGEANATPLGPMLPGASQGRSTITDVRWVCGPWGCHWRPGWYGPRPYWGRRCWWHPTPWGPRRVCRVW
ncbi:conserved hypothetical protein [Methylobacterium nodulans ORS 2060]|uniref:Uncharacterized protein n=1 Tax=Methylobacterium nodulans (strain LMG 21967 / CNCM I-2342 / ORS 2060) TaxID=460265 RepID=B8IPR2_METNO|nr:conserved hypothetical protein [Methylobacterium nodulans ORS 2060]